MILLFIMKRRCSSGTPTFKIRTAKLRGGQSNFMGDLMEDLTGDRQKNDLEISLLLK